MMVLVGILAYLGFAMLVGRFLSLSTRGVVVYAPTLLGDVPAEAVRRTQRPAPPQPARKPDKKKRAEAPVDDRKEKIPVA